MSARDLAATVRKPLEHAMRDDGCYLSVPTASHALAALADLERQAADAQADVERLRATCAHDAALYVTAIADMEVRAVRAEEALRTVRMELDLPDRIAEIIGDVLTAAGADTAPDEGPTFHEGPPPRGWKRYMVADDEYSPEYQDEYRRLWHRDQARAVRAEEALRQIAGLDGGPAAVYTKAGAIAREALAAAGADTPPWDEPPATANPAGSPKVMQTFPAGADTPPPNNTC